jgi:hypothetical protein
MGDETVEIVRRFIEDADLSKRLNNDQARQLATDIVDRLRKWNLPDTSIERIFG